jgi:hypothetical protein
LSKTSWGEPKPSKNTLVYIAHHPWMRVLDHNDLIALRPNMSCGLSNQITPVDSYIPHTNRGELIPSLLTSEQIQSNILTELSLLPQNPITSLAWQTYLNLTSPAGPSLNELRANYLGQVGHIIAAARWANQPTPIADCATDIDWDGQPECILASENLFSSYELEGGYLEFLFFKSSSNFHQIIAPTSELVIGISDQSSWSPQQGLLGDTNQILGAFTQKSTLAEDYESSSTPEELIIQSPDMSIRKLFRLMPYGLHVEIDNNDGQSLYTQIPLVMDPWLRFLPGWGNLYYDLQATEQNGLIWGITPAGPSVEIKSSNHLSLDAFYASRSYLASPEDPNFDYPLGHFLPFPLAVVNLQIQNNTEVDIYMIP